MNIRKVLKYPPFYNFSIIKIIGNDYELCFKEANKICIYLRDKLNELTVLGPSNCFIPKINNNYYIQITLKYKKSNYLINELKFISEKYITNKKIRIEIDINPI